MRRLATGLMAAAALAMLATGVHAQDKRKVKIGTEGAYPPFNSIDTERQAGRLRRRHRQRAVRGGELRVRVRGAGLGRHHPGLDRQEVRRDHRFDVDHRRAQESGRLHRQVLSDPGEVRRAPRAPISTSTPEGLAGMAIGVQRATIHENFVRAKFPEADVRSYATQDEANADLMSGRARPGHGGFGRPARGVPQDRRGQGLRVRRARLLRSEVSRRGRRHRDPQGRGGPAPGLQRGDRQDPRRRHLPGDQPRSTSTSTSTGRSRSARAPR